MVGPPGQSPGNPADLVANRAAAYDTAGACVLSTSSPYYTSATPNLRTCVGDRNHACNRDFDCYGHCSKDQGFICTDDADCHLGGTDTPPSNATALPSDANHQKLSTYPANRLTCGSSGNPQACTGLGWLSFNKIDGTGNPPTNDCSAVGSSDACYLGGSGDIVTGWGRLLTLANINDPNSQYCSNDQTRKCTSSSDCVAPGTCNATAGWIHLRGSTVAGVPPYNTCQNCTGNLSCSFCQDSQHHSCTNATNCTYYCQGTNFACSTDAQCDTQYPGAGKSCAPKSICSGDQTTLCSGDSDCVGNGRCVQGATCTSVGSCSQYGVNLDPHTQQFSGYAWSSDLGWLDFSGLQAGNPLYVQTRLGDIFAGGRIGTPTTNLPPAGLCNGTYLITSHTSITNFCSAQAGGLQTQAPNISSPSSANTYTNVLGRLDLTGIERDVGGGKNKYGSPIVTLQPSVTGDIGQDFNFGSSLPTGDGGQGIFLSGKVYEAPAGNISIDEFLHLEKGDTSNSFSNGNGAGVLVVNGNLTVNANIVYDNQAIQDLRQLASLVVIVKGDLTISSGVTDLGGTYLVFGTVRTTSVDAMNNTIASNVPLTVRGLMIAQKFEFRRTFAGTTESPSPSELVIFDGRFQSNPLPGMTDFASALPNTLGANP